MVGGLRVYANLLKLLVSLFTKEYVTKAAINTDESYAETGSSRWTRKSWYPWCKSWMEWNETSEKHAPKFDWTRNSMMMIYNKQVMKDAYL